jgi:hypothetical protein
MFGNFVKCPVFSDSVMQIAIRADGETSSPSTQTNTMR